MPIDKCHPIIKQNLQEKDYVLHYLISTTKIYAVLKNSVFLMRNANVNFPRTLAAIFMNVNHDYQRYGLCQNHIFDN